MDQIIIREIQKNDNQAIANVIRNVLIELNVPKVGTAYADPQLDFMYETYSVPNTKYFVVTKNGLVVGGAGISHLPHEDQTVCELQKMYFRSEIRGFGIGTQLMERCLESAKGFGYKKCYLETMPYMIDAQKLYKKVGFEYLCQPMGNTGHTSCPVWMMKQL